MCRTNLRMQKLPGNFDKCTEVHVREPFPELIFFQTEKRKEKEDTPYAGNCLVGKLL